MFETPVISGSFTLVVRTDKTSNFSEEWSVLCWEKCSAPDPARLKWGEQREVRPGRGTCLSQGSKADIGGACPRKVSDLVLLETILVLFFFGKICLPVALVSGGVPRGTILEYTNGEGLSLATRIRNPHPHPHPHSGEYFLSQQRLAHPILVTGLLWAIVQKRALSYLSSKPSSLPTPFALSPHRPCTVSLLHFDSWPFLLSSGYSQGFSLPQF